MQSCFYALAVFFVFYPIIGVYAAVADDIASKNQQIQEIQQQVDAYQQQIDTIHSQALTLQGQVKSLTAKISQITLELKSLGISISETNLEIADTETKIGDAEAKITKDQETLGQYLRVLYRNDQESLTSILLKNDTLSEFFNDLNRVKTTQDDLKLTIDSIKDLEVSLEDQKTDLESKKADLEQQQGLVQVEQRSLAGSKAEKDKLLKDTQGQESKFQVLVKQSKTDIARLQDQVYYLLQNGVSVEDAVKYGQLAAIATGIRPAFLIAELEVESGLGQNVGKCNRPGDPPSKGFRVIMHSYDIQPFLTITSQLGKDPNTTAVSCPQYVNGRQYGYGGAMGPAQFIPTTWVAYAADVARIVGRVFADPWKVEDAFTAAAIKLARAGATANTKAAEIAASKAYYSGKANCSSGPCNSYANAVQRTAADIELSL